MYKFIYHFSRIVIAATFIFSGFVKGQDPLGFTFKLEDYFIAYGWDWAMPFALYLSIALCAYEFVLGVGLLLNLQIRLVSWLTLLTMIFFTGLTFYDALYNPVPDCGCFGDAIILTNWQTFYKNVVLMGFLVLLFRFRSKASAKPNAMKGQFLALVVMASFFALFSYWSYTNLPVFDFLPWKEGNRLYAEQEQPVQYFVTYRNNQTGETREYPANDYPYQDETWLSQWSFVSSRVYDPNVTIKHELVIVDSSGSDLTSHYLKNPDYQFIITVYDPKHAPVKAMEEISSLAREIEASGHSVVLLTNALAEEIVFYSKKFNWVEDVHNADDIALKMMVRANPGLVLIRNSVILEKWNGRKLPGFEELKQKYFDTANP